MKQNLCTGRRSSPEGTEELLFVGTISPMICPADGPALSRNDLLTVLKRHDGDVPFSIREFHILMWDYKNGRFRRIICGKAGDLLCLQCDG